MANLYPDFARFEAEGTVFGSINKDSFEKLPFVIPPDDIVARLRMSVRSTRRKNLFPRESQSRFLAALPDTLLPKLLSRDLSVGESSLISHSV
jgi:type I restriction enzyme S subunit